MDNPIDHVLDLGLVNYIKHPENGNYVVFRFSDKQRADSFENYLLEDSIWFEKGEEERKNKTYHLFGIHKNDYKKVSKINFRVEAQHRKPLIPYTYLRYFLLSFSFFVLTLALIGYCSAGKTKQVINETTTPVNTTLSPNE
jgi:hypothetical protein